jgi:hypothetical protein
MKYTTISSFINYQFMLISSIKIFLHNNTNMIINLKKDIDFCIVKDNCQFLFISKSELIMREKIPLV